MPRLANREPFLALVKERYGNVTTLNRTMVNDVSQALGIVAPAWLVQEPRRRVGRGLYSIDMELTPRTKEPKARTRTRKIEEVLPPVAPTVPTVEASVLAMSGNSSGGDISLIPEKSPGYVPFGNFADIRSIIKSGEFYPTFITGLSGNGKTLMVEQICAQEKREYVRANITRKTDEDELIGGFRLVDGNTVWQDGPVLVAMQRGAILLLDEVDLGDAKIMCLQPVLEGKPIYIKSVNKVVRPAPGFNILATANTKGKGSNDGRFIGTNIMNEAFLERFSVTFEQEYPPAKTEEKILENLLALKGIEAGDFASKLVQWADVTRITYAQDGSSELISTRRLVHIIGAYIIFGQNRKKAIELCLNRFDPETKASFMETYLKIDATPEPKAATGASDTSADNIEVTF